MVRLATSLHSQLKRFVHFIISKRIIPVYYNLGIIFVVSVSNNKIVLTKLIAEIKAHGNVSKKKSVGSRNAEHQNDLFSVHLIKCTDLHFI